MTTWTVTLIVCLATPALMHWRPASIPAPFAGSWPMWSFMIIDENPAATPETSPPVTASLPTTATAQARQAAATPSVTPKAAVARDTFFLKPVSVTALGAGVYLGGAGVLLARLLIGLVLTQRLRREARPIIERWTSGQDVRLSGVIKTPVTFGSTILLPTQCLNWSPAKRLAALAHERSHVAQGDFYVLAAATVHRALFWFSPFSWWLLAELAETAELVSDDAAVEATGDRPRYAEILLDFAKSGGHVPAAVGMARTRTTFQRVERVLASTSAQPKLGRTARLLIAAGLVPLAVLTTASFAQHSNDQANPAATAGDGVLAPYLGHYQPERSATLLTVSADGDRLFIQESGKPRLALNADSTLLFSNTAVNISVAFMPHSGEQASELILNDTARGSRRARRIDDAEAKRLENDFAEKVSTTVSRFKSQAPAAESKDFLIRHIAELRKVTPNFDEMASKLAEAVRQQSPSARLLLARLGDLEQLRMKGVTFNGAEIYDVKFSKGSAVWLLALGTDRKIQLSNFYPVGDATPGGVRACAEEAGLKGSEDAAPIRIRFSNQSGAEVQVFALTAEGTRQPQGHIKDNELLNRITAVSTPWIVTDAAGNCLEIVLPGQSARDVVIPPVSSEPSSSFGTQPAENGERLLRAYIERIQRHDPDLYKETQLTGLALGLLHETLRQFGELKSVAFQGVGATGDRYHLEFANGSTDVRMTLRKDGTIGGVQIGPEA